MSLTLPSLYSDAARTGNIQENWLFQLYYDASNFVGISFTEAYNLPIFLRSFYLKRLQKAYEEEKKEVEKQSKQSKGISRPGVPRGK